MHKIKSLSSEYRIAYVRDSVLKTPVWLHPFESLIYVRGSFLGVMTSRIHHVDFRII